MHGLVLGRDRMFRAPVDIVMAALALVVTLIFASLLWRFLEQPIVAWGHSFQYGKSKNDVVVLAPQVPS
jgi:peptidoglycan/LPS O-acetylase OafA/YrhL